MHMEEMTDWTMHLKNPHYFICLVKIKYIQKQKPPNHFTTNPDSCQSLSTWAKTLNNQPLKTSDNLHSTSRKKNACWWIQNLIRRKKHWFIVLSNREHSQPISPSMCNNLQRLMFTVRTQWSWAQILVYWNQIVL